MFIVIVILIILGILLLAILASAIPSRPGVVQRDSLESNASPTQRVEPVRESYMQLPAAGTVAPAQIQSPPVAMPGPRTDLIPADDDFVPVGQSDNLTALAPDDDMTDVFAAWNVTTDFVVGEISKHPDAPCWLTGQPMIKCQCTDCHNWRTQRDIQ